LIHIAGLRIVGANDPPKPTIPPAIPPRIVRPRQYITSSTGKFALAAMPKATPTIGDILLSKPGAPGDGNNADNDRRDTGDEHLAIVVGLAESEDTRIEIM
jgi:hypothetical protein